MLDKDALKILQEMQGGNLQILWIILVCVPTCMLDAWYFPTLSPRLQGLCTLLDKSFLRYVLTPAACFSKTKTCVADCGDQEAENVLQIVVTKKLTNSLLQIVHKPELGRRPDPVNNQWTANDNALLTEAVRLLGLDDAALQNQRNISYFGVERSLLVYMAAAVMHPNQEWRSKFRDVLQSRNIDLDKIGESLVTFIRFFISSLPMTSAYNTRRPNNGVTNLTGHFFNCLEQGKRVEKTFDSFANGNNAQATFEHTGMPVVYLGPLVTRANCQAAYNSIPAMLVNAGNATHHLDGNLWRSRWNSEDIDREVRESDFLGPNPDDTTPQYLAQYPGLRGRVYPIPDTEKIRQEDFQAIMKSINVQDCLVAFCQMMVKRFFFKQPFKFVETSVDPIGRDESNNQANNQDNNPISRIALTSNEYPMLKCGSEVMQQQQQTKWEIVIVRPNIEHNMLGVILGRGGINELGATFWGQTELSCYDDSMHGIWGMSYKYHERAMVSYCLHF